MKLDNDIIMITEKRYKQLLKEARRNEIRELKVILFILNSTAKLPEKSKVISINKLIVGYEERLKELIEEEKDYD